MISSVRSKSTTRDTFSLFSLFPFLAMIIALLLGSILVIAGPYAWALLIGTMILAVILILRQDELAATIVIATHLYIDWYVGLRVSALLSALMLLIVFFLTRSPRRPWVKPRALWLWSLLLALAIFPSIRGALGLYDALYYFPNIFFGALLFFWLGIVMAHDTASVRRLFQALAVLATLLAIHTLIEAKTGIILFASSSFATHFGDALYYHFELGQSDVYRIGSFFIDPNWNGTFFALMLFLPLGLLASSRSPLAKTLYLMETVVILIALLFTSSAGAWISSFVGLLVFITFLKRNSYRFLIVAFIVVVGIVLVVWFPSEVNFLQLHATDPVELSLRNGAWKTAQNVILAFPLTGVGLGIIGYAQRVEPYRVPAQFVPLAHPHNSYLELGAMAGLPVLVTFVALIVFALWLALRNWSIADVRTRSLLAGGIAAIAVLSFNSVSINAWTLPPLAAIGWLILGAISSPSLAKSQISEREPESTTSHSSQDLEQVV